MRNWENKLEEHNSVSTRDRREWTMKAYHISRLVHRNRCRDKPHCIVLMLRTLTNCCQHRSIFEPFPVFLRNPYKNFVLDFLRKNTLSCSWRPLTAFKDSDGVHANAPRHSYGGSMSFVCHFSLFVMPGVTRCNTSAEVLRSFRRDAMSLSDSRSSSANRFPYCLKRCRLCIHGLQRRRLLSRSSCRCQTKAAATTARSSPCSCSCIRCSCSHLGIIALLKIKLFRRFSSRCDDQDRIVEGVDGRHLSTPTKCAEIHKISILTT